MTASQWVETIHRLNIPAEKQYARCLRTEKVYGIDSRQAKTEYTKYAAMLTSIAVDHYRIWLKDYTDNMIALAPKIGKEAVLQNFATLELTCNEWQRDILVDQRNRVATIRTVEDSILKIQVSGFKNYISVDPISITLFDFLKSVKYAPQVDAIRSEKDKARRDAIKATLPCICPSGVFTKRSEAGLVAHSGFIQFDIDEKGNEAYFEGVEDEMDRFNLLQSIKAEIAKQPFVAYIGLSVSGRGLWGLIPVSEPTEHKAHFDSIVLFFANMGIVLDKAPSNVASLRGYSYDRAAYFNHNAEKYADKVYPVQGVVSQPRQYESRSEQSEFEKTSNLVHQITQQRIDITGNYMEWLSIALVFSSEFGEAGRDLFHSVSQFHPKYTFAGANKKFDNCMRVKAKKSIAAFYAIAKQHGVTLKRQTA